MSRASEHLRATTRGSFDLEETLDGEVVMEVQDNEVTVAVISDADKTYAP